MAFNLSSELVYTNVLNCIDLSGIPLRSADRGADDPLVGAGGHCTYNPEPLADFIDFFVLGDGEEVVSELTYAIHQWKNSEEGNLDRERILRNLVADRRGICAPFV